MATMNFSVPDDVKDAFNTAFAAQTAFLHAAEGDDFVGEDAVIDGDHAVLQAFGDAPGAVYVLGEEITRQAKRRVVGDGDSFVLG